MVENHVVCDTCGTGRWATARKCARCRSRSSPTPQLPPLPPVMPIWEEPRLEDNFFLGHIPAPRIAIRPAPRHVPPAATPVTRNISMAAGPWPSPRPRGRQQPALSNPFGQPILQIRPRRNSWADARAPTPPLRPREPLGLSDLLMATLASSANIARVALFGTARPGM